MEAAGHDTGHPSDRSPLESGPPASVVEPATDSISAPVREILEASSLPGPPPTDGKPFGVRAGAYIIDFAIYNAAAFVLTMVGLLIVSILLAFGGMTFAPKLEEGSGYQAILISQALSVFYFAAYEWLFGATPGKAILKLRVVREDGRRASLWSVIVRGLFRLVDGLFFGWPAARSMSRTPMRQRIGDRAARTVVVGSDDPIIQAPRSWAWFGLASVVALIALTAGGVVLALDDMEVVPLPIPGEAPYLGLRMSELPAPFGLESARKISLDPAAVDGSQSDPSQSVRVPDRP